MADVLPEIQRGVEDETEVRAVKEAGVVPHDEVAKRHQSLNIAPSAKEPPTTKQYPLVARRTAIGIAALAITSVAAVPAYAPCFNSTTGAPEACIGSGNGGGGGGGGGFLTPAQAARQESEQFNARGAQLVMLGNYDGALAQYKLAENQDPTNPMAHSNIATMEAMIAWRDGSSSRQDAKLVFSKLNSALSYGVNLPNIRKIAAQIARQRLERIDKRDSKLSYEERGRVYDLNDLRKRFQEQAGGFTDWAKEADRERTQVYKTMSEQINAQILGFAVEGLLSGSIDDRFAQAKGEIAKLQAASRDVRFAKSDLKPLVDELRDEIRTAVRGKSKDDAQAAAMAIFRRRLSAAHTTALKDAARTADTAGEWISKNMSVYEDQNDPLTNMPATTFARIQKDLTEAYPYLLNVLGYAKDHGMKAAQDAGKAVPVLALVPNAIDWITIFGTAYVDKKNIDALQDLNQYALRRLDIIQNGIEEIHLPAGDPLGDLGGAEILGLKQIVPERKELAKERATMNQWIKQGL
jgi:hypothetical protein